jgi:hypothetical protein
MNNNLLKIEDWKFQISFPSIFIFHFPISNSPRSGAIVPPAEGRVLRPPSAS